MVASLGKFASTAYQAWVYVDDLKIQVAEREKVEAELRELTDSLEGKFTSGRQNCSVASNGCDWPIRQLALEPLSLMFRPV